MASDGKLWLCEVTYKTGEGSQEVLEVKELFLCVDTAPQLEQQICGAFNFIKETEVKLWNSNGQFLPAPLLVGLLNGGQPGVEKLKAVKVLKDDEETIKLRVSFSTSDPVRAVVKQKRRSKDSEEDEEVKTFDNSIKPFTERARIALSLYAPRDDEGILIAKSDKRFTDTKHDDYNFFQARHAFHMDIMHKLEQGIVDWFNNQKDEEEENITLGHVRQYLNRRRHEIGMNKSRCLSEETRGRAAWNEFDITTATGMIRKQWEDGHACCTVKLPIGGDPHELILTGPPKLPKHATAAGAGASKSKSAPSFSCTTNEEVSKFFSPLPSATMKASALLALPATGSGDHDEASAADTSKMPTPRRSPRKNAATGGTKVTETLIGKRKEKPTATKQTRGQKKRLQ
eukprot:jgi/Botrbrau1/16113/Bobra.7_2s0076.1